VPCGCPKHLVANCQIHADSRAPARTRAEVGLRRPLRLVLVVLRLQLCHKKHPGTVMHGHVQPSSPPAHREIVCSGGVIPARARMPRRPRAALARAQQIKSQGLHKGRHRRPSYLVRNHPGQYGPWQISVLLGTCLGVYGSHRRDVGCTYQVGHNNNEVQTCSTYTAGASR
jgi:hypothetical protein